MAEAVSASATSASTAAMTTDVSHCESAITAEEYRALVDCNITAGRPLMSTAASGDGTSRYR